MHEEISQSVTQYWKKNFLKHTFTIFLNLKIIFFNLMMLYIIYHHTELIDILSARFSLLFFAGLLSLKLKPEIESAPTGSPPVPLATMAAPSNNFIRVRLEFDYPPPALVDCRMCWLLVDRTACRVVADLESLVREKFDFSRRSILNLFVESCYLPHTESIYVVRDNDSVRWAFWAVSSDVTCLFVFLGDDCSLVQVLHLVPLAAPSRWTTVIGGGNGHLGEPSPLLMSLYTSEHSGMYISASSQHE